MHVCIFTIWVREYFTFYLDVNIVARWIDGGKYFARHFYCLWVKVCKYWYRPALGIYITFNQGGFFMYAYCDRGPRFFGNHPKNRFMKSQARSTIELFSPWSLLDNRKTDRPMWKQHFVSTQNNNVAIFNFLLNTFLNKISHELMNNQVSKISYYRVNLFIE